MHKLYWKTHEQIECVLARGISTSNIQYLGMLVDICKDIKEMEYYKAKTEKIHMEEEESRSMKHKMHERMEHKHHEDYDDDDDETLEELVKKFTMMAERYSNSMSEHDKKKVVELAHDMIEDANMLKGVLTAYDIDEDIRAKVSRIFK